LASKGALFDFLDREAVRAEKDCRTISGVAKADLSVDHRYYYLQRKLGSTEAVGRYFLLLLLTALDCTKIDYRAGAV
jgi:hypothetical protein